MKVKLVGQVKGKELKKENKEYYECPTCGCKGNYMNGVRDGEARCDALEKVEGKIADLHDTANAKNDLFYRKGINDARRIIKKELGKS